ncbi:MAG: peptidoglycan-binding protein, partial [Acidobacteria bacterium]|nr:peptidoglycan-binding protein [Acidobacteriota bacterium]
MPVIADMIRLNSKGSEVKKLQADLRALGFRSIPVRELSAASFGVGTRDALLAFQKSQKIAETGVLDDATLAQLQKAKPGTPGRCCVTGRISGLPSGGMTLALYHHAFGQKPVLLGKKTAVQADGHFVLDYSAPDATGATPSLNIELKAEYQEGAKKKNCSLTGVRYNASRYEVLDLVMPAETRPVRSEYDGILDALSSHIGDKGKLEDLKEDEKAKDFTFLANATGVDGRNLVLASAAARMAKKTGIEAQALYALFQNGLTPGERSLALARPEEIKKALESAVGNKQIQLTVTIDKTIAVIMDFARKKRPTLRARGALSSYRELIDASGLSRAEKDAFLEIFFNHQGTEAGLWEAAHKKFISMGSKKNDTRNKEKDVEKKIQVLRLQGRLARLTRVNVPLIEYVQKKIKAPGDLRHLVDYGFDKPEAWEGALRTLARGKKDLGDLIPPIYSGKDANERLAAYAAAMARMVRASFPHQSIRRKIREKELILTTGASGKEHEEITAHVVDFLDQAESLGFTLGKTPLGRFIGENRKKLFKKKVDPDLKSALVRKALENRNRVDARSFILKNWKGAFKGISKETLKFRPVLMASMQNRELNGIKLADLINKKKGTKAIQKALGAKSAGTFTENLARIFREEEKLLPADAEAAFRGKVRKAVKTLVRLFQVSPDDAALQVLSNIGVSSAHEISTFAPEAFADAYAREAGKLGKSENQKGTEAAARKTAKAMYQKARLIHATTLNVAVSARQMGGESVQKISGFRPVDAGSASGDRSVLPDGLIPSVSDRTSAAMRTLIRQYPVLEELLGSTDYCECRECQSVLGPAAYLVDLFRFLEHADQDPNDGIGRSWNEFLRRWKERHNGARYPFKSREAAQRWRDEHPRQTAFQEMTPYQILLKHRPDLPHLPLTCENTNTLVPYIDLVNEILEYYLLNPRAANESESSLIDEFIRNDTGGAASEDLVAEPQNILPAAYDFLRDESFYPLDLPFDLWLETVRLFFSHFDTPLWTALEALRSRDDLDLYASAAGDTAARYHRVHIFMEQLKLSPKEYTLFTSGSQPSWERLYGYADPVHANDELRSAKTLARRLGVTCKELVEIVKTCFVNPGLAELGLVWKLGIEIADAVAYFEKRGTAEYAAQEESFEHALQEAQEKHSCYFAARQTTAKDELEKRWPDSFRRTLVLRDKPGPDDSGRVVSSGFDHTVLEYARAGDDGDASAAASDFLRINLFVRLWKKLGWTIDETDQALTSFWPKSITIQTGPTTSGAVVSRRRKDLASGFATVLIYLAHLKFLEEKLRPGRDGRQKLLSLWADLPVTGKKPLYG